MHLDVVDLKSFYASRLGMIASARIGACLRRRWPTAAGDRILGLGYATPYLAQFGEDAERRLAFMPAQQGIVSWPNGGLNAAALVRDDALPLEGASIDRVLAIHSLEHAESAHETLREIWRVLAPGGRLLIVVPNRAGMWARVERTPFGHGRPFSRGQLGDILRETMFTPVTWSSALAMPPIRNRVFLRSGVYWENAGARLWRGFSGVLIVEATKLIQQRVKAKAKLPRTSRVLSPSLAPTAGVTSTRSR
jgi:SAM-dependent methyltransferase